MSPLCHRKLGLCWGTLWQSSFGNIWKCSSLSTFHFIALLCGTQENLFSFQYLIWSVSWYPWQITRKLFCLDNLISCRRVPVTSWLNVCIVSDVVPCHSKLSLCWGTLWQLCCGTVFGYNHSIFLSFIVKLDCTFLRYPIEFSFLLTLSLVCIYVPLADFKVLSRNCYELRKVSWIILPSVIKSLLSLS